MSINIAIDGPAGAGKSTIAKKVAKNRGYIYVDTGAMYRAMALYLIRENIDSKDSAAIEAACENADISIEYRDGEQVVLLNGENVNAFLRTEEVGNMASASSVNGKVRAKLQQLQQKLAASADVVMDGRDIVIADQQGGLAGGDGAEAVGQQHAAHTGGIPDRAGFRAEQQVAPIDGQAVAGAVEGRLPLFAHVADLQAPVREEIAAHLR